MSPFEAGSPLGLFGQGCHGSGRERGLKAHSAHRPVDSGSLTRSVGFMVTHVEFPPMVARSWRSFFRISLA